MKKFILIFLGLIIILVGWQILNRFKFKSESPLILQPEDKSPQKQLKEVKKVIFRTEDGVEIVANYYPNEEAKYGGILVHMMPATKESFHFFARKLQAEGFAVLALDLRGHGESVNSVSGKLDYRKFTDEEHQKSILDLEAGSKFLENQGFPKSAQFLIGASIGANLSLEFLNRYPETKAVVLLSPGLNYRGIEILPLVKKEFQEKLFLSATKYDPNESYLAVKKILEIIPETKNVLFEQNKAHGTEMLSLDDLEKEIITWLKLALIK